MKVLITTIPFAENNKRPLELLTAAGVEYLINPLGRKLEEEEIGELITNFDAVIAGTERISDQVMAQARNLKLIVRVGIGLDNVDLLAARRREIQVSYTPDAPSPAVAELTIGMMLTLLRSIQICNTRMHRGQWHRYFGRRLSEVTIGIIGVGRIGSRVIRLLEGFDCTRILINDINPQVTLLNKQVDTVEVVDKETIYEEADIITMHVPLTETTRNLITEKELQMMKPDVLLINTSRGGIINERELFNSLEGGHLGGVALDVFEEEPYIGNLATIERCLLTSHMGSMSIDCRERMEVEATEEVVRFSFGRHLELVVPEEEYDTQL